MSQIRTIAIIAEGIPENYTRKLIKVADSKNVTIIGPATVGGVKPGCFKIGMYKAISTVRVAIITLNFRAA